MLRHPSVLAVDPLTNTACKIDSYRIEGGLKMEYMPEPHHQAFPGMVNGGIIGTLLDCHGNWTAAIALMDEQGLAEPPCTVYRHVRCST